MAYETLKYEQADHVVTLTYNRPEQHNAINPKAGNLASEWPHHGL
jgi:1,4-dihydroxy-2-naphthoyl-CoA synthase